MENDGEEEGLQIRQGVRLYPLGRALRSTFDADNHDTLGSDVTGLMIDLSKVPFDDRSVFEPAPAPPAEPLPGRSNARPSILARLSGLIARR